MEALRQSPAICLLDVDPFGVTWSGTTDRPGQPFSFCVEAAGSHYFLPILNPMLEPLT